MVSITPINRYDLEYIAYNMRESDRREIFAILRHDSEFLLAHEAYTLIENNGRGAIAWHDGKPAGLAALTEMHPKCWQIWMFGTDDFKAVVFPLVRWFRRECNDILDTLGAHRLQCDSQVGHDEAFALIKSMGAVEEGPPMRRYGKDGTDFQRFVWIAGENDQVLRPHFKRAA